MFQIYGYIILISKRLILVWDQYDLLKHYLPSRNITEIKNHLYRRLNEYLKSQNQTLINEKLFERKHIRGNFDEKSLFKLIVKYQIKKKEFKFGVN